MGGASRSNCNRGVEHVAIIRLNMARDWRWVIRHRAEAEAALQTAKLSTATKGITPGTPAYREAVINTLRKLAARIATPGSDLNLLVTGGVSP